MMQSRHSTIRVRCAVLLLALVLAAGGAAGDGTPVLRIEPGGHTAAVRQILFADGGRKLVSVGGDKVVRIWDVEQATQIGHGLRYPIGDGPQGGIYAAALSPDGRVAVGGYDVVERTGRGGGEFGVTRERLAYMHILDLAGTTLRTLETPHRDVITSLAFSAAGGLMASASADGTAVVWDAEQLRSLRTLNHKDVVTGVAFSPDGALLATSCYDGNVRIWDARGGALKKTLNCRAPVQCLAWSPTGDTLAAGTRDAHITLWDPAAGRERKTLTQPDNPTSLAFSADGAWLLSGSGENRERNDRRARVWSVADGRVLQEFGDHTATVLAVAFPPAGRDLAASADLAGVIRLWNPSTGQSVARLKGTGSSVYSVAWSADGKSVAWGTTEDRALQFTFRLDRAEPGPPVARGALAGWRGAATQAGDRTLSINNPAGGGVNQRPSVALSSGGREVARINGDTGDRINAAAFTPSGQVAVASDFGLALYGPRGNLLRRLLGHTGSVLDVAASPDGTMLASASADQTVRVWNLKEPPKSGSSRPLLSIFQATDGAWVAWAEEGYYAASPTGDDIIGWQVDRGPNRPAELQTAFQMHEAFYRPDVVSLLTEAGSVAEAIKRAKRPQVQVPTETAAETAARLPTVALVEVGPAARQGDAWSTRSEQVKVRVRVTNLEPADTISLRVNRPVTSKRLSETPQADRPDERVLDATLAQGTNVLTVVARTRAGESQPLTVTVTREVAAADRRPENLMVLAVGVSQYRDSKIDGLRFADRDAQEVAQFYQGQSGKLFDTVRVSLLDNDKATRQSMMAGMDALQAGTGPDDTAIVYVSSHGFEDKGAFYFALNDAARDHLGDTGVSWQDVIKRLEGLNARNVLLIVDQCYSGGVQEEMVRGYRPANEAARSARQANILTFSASNADELSWEHPKWQHGAFTYALLAALRGQAAGMQYPGGRVMLNKVEDYVVERVEQIVEETVGSRQTPSLFTLPGGYTHIPIAHVP